MRKPHWLEIRQVPDDIEILRSSVSESEWAAAMSMKSPRRRAEWLTWRAAAGERLGRGIVSYDRNGAPVLPEGMGHIGVSHTSGWITVVWSPEPCAVDIEHVSRDVSHTSGRFISASENTLPDSVNPLFPISVWCAKEAAYKLARIPGLDFLEDIAIVSSDIARGAMEADIRGRGTVRAELLYRDGLVIAVIV